ncbi:MAG: glutamate-5-semialdehyde dehydrogenase [Saccharofermentans sp.]|nr:glutamate-5-semialdehyde dehydrogenase [Saccharofermentans sp.]
MSDIKVQANVSKQASFQMAILDTNLKDNALKAVAEALEANKDYIFEANNRDLDNAVKEGLEGPLVKRLKFDEHKLSDVIEGINSLIGLDDPVGKVKLHTTLDDGLELYRVTCPIGVIGIIFESRPDALVQISSLCLKSGNSVFLKGGREALETNKALYSVIRNASIEAGLPDGWINLLETRDDVSEMLTLNEYIDLIIPRGSNSFVQYIMNNTLIPVMGHADGVCHTYVDVDADIEKAMDIVVDAKTQYVSVCNATETVLINKSLDNLVKGEIVKALEDHGVRIHFEDDITEWHHEYLDYDVSIKFVESVDDAINHINKYGSGHTEAIITENRETAEYFMNKVDASSVMLNASTRFADGFRYGFGAEVGVSTSKLHARGPVGLEGLISYKYKIYGNGNIVADYASGKKTFKHIRREV